MAHKTWSWRSRLPDLSAAVSRFPLAVAIALGLTLYKLLNTSWEEPKLRIIGALIACFYWVVAVDFYAEGRRASLPFRAGLWLAGCVAIALLFYFFWEVYLSPYFLVLALLLSVGFSAYLSRRESNPIFWMFNHRLWLGAALAALGAVLFGAGLAIILKTLNYLFGLTLPDRWYEDIWTVSLGLIAPVSWLAFAPTDLEERAPEGRQTEFTSRAVASIVKFVLVPMLLVYTAILYAYAIKIAVEWTLPKGTLGNMVVGYLLTGAATLLLAYPTRNSGGLLVRLFWRYWVWLVVLPVGLLFLAVSRRIGDYGVTEDRYLVVLVGLWALILAVARGWRGDSLDLKLVPLVLAVLLLFASFGPWGAIGLSVRSQANELARLLEARGFLVDGRFVRKSESGEPVSWLGTDAARIRGIEWYLNQHRALSQLKPWFEGQDKNPFAPGNSPADTEREIFAALGVRPEFRVDAETRFFTHYTDQPTNLTIQGAGHVIGPIVLQGSAAPGYVSSQSVAVSGVGEVKFSFADNILTAKIENGPELAFNVLEIARSFANQIVPNHDPVTLRSTAGEFAATVVIDNFNGNFNDPVVNPSLLRFWLILDTTP